MLASSRLLPFLRSLLRSLLRSFLRSLSRFVFLPLAALLTATVLAVAACGGGGTQVAGSPGVVGTGPALVTIGTITGFGSIFVNGVEFEDSGATVEDEEDVRRSNAELKLGMVVEIRAQQGANPAQATAQSIRIINNVRGAVEQLDAAAGVLRVLGVQIAVTSQTVFERLAGIADLAVNDSVEVFGYFDRASQVLTATRIERLPTLPAGTAKTRGVVGEVNATAKTFRLNTLVVDYSQARLKRLPDGVQNGALVKVKGAIGADGRFVATEVQGLESATQTAVENADRATVEGVIASFQSTASFKVGDQTVDASSAQFPSGRAQDLANGVRVRVSGAVRNGVLVADKVMLRRAAVEPADEFVLKGPIGAFTGLASFKVKGVDVDASRAQIVGGAATDLRNGVKVEVHGALVGTSKNSVLQATEIRLTGPGGG